MLMSWRLEYQKLPGSMSLLLKSLDLSSKPSRLVQTLWQVNEPAEEEPRLLQRRAPVRSTAENEVLDRVSVNGTI